MSEDNAQWIVIAIASVLSLRAMWVAGGAAAAVNSFVSIFRGGR